GLSGAELPAQHDRSAWPAMRERFAGLFAQHTRAHWVSVFEGTEACVTPVLSIAEAAQHPHLRARASLVEVGGVLQPAPVPRFSRTPGAVAGPPVARGQGGQAAVADWGLAAADAA